MAEPMVFLKTGWMEYYDGRLRGDRISGAFGHIKKTGSGHEDQNFKKRGQYYYGYAPFNDKKMNLEKYFDADRSAKYIDNVTVVWISKAPGNRGVVVVGWYEHARLFASYHRFGDGRVCLAKALIADCKLISPDDRALHIYPAPRNTNVWYAQGRDALKRDVRRLIAGTYRAPVSGQRRSAPDRSQILAVELAAVKAVWDHYEGKGFQVETFETENLGWDLVAAKGKLEFRLEVKGTNLKTISTELTPNEYAMARKHRILYRICIVTEALTSADVHVFRYSDEFDGWIDETGKRKLLVKELVGARLTG